MQGRGLILAMALALTGFAAGAQEVVKSGQFSGDSGHDTSGLVQIVAADGGYVLRLSDDFLHDGTAPDATVGFGMDGYAEAFNLGRLPKNDGPQEFVLPAGFDPALINEVYIWCKQFSVSLGSAEVN